MSSERLIAQAYRRMFKDYPDVVDVKTMRKMLNNTGKKEAYELLRTNQILHRKRGRAYLIPKIGIIAYLLDHDPLT